MCYSAVKRVEVVGSKCGGISSPRHLPVFTLGFSFSGRALARPNSEGRAKVKTGSVENGSLPSTLREPGSLVPLHGQLGASEDQFVLWR